MHLGNRRVPTFLKVDPDLPRDALLIGAEEAVALGLSAPVLRGFTLRLRAMSANELRLGPVIGVLLGRTREEIRQNRHGYRPFEMMWNIRSLGGIVYYFSLEDIDWQGQWVQGHVYVPPAVAEAKSPAATATPRVPVATSPAPAAAPPVPVGIPPARVPLEAARLPFPDCIYRRRFIPYDQLARLQSSLTPFIFNNPRASHKLRQAEALRQVPPLAAHLPETRELRSAQVLDAMLQRHRAVYVKRSGLGAGRGVFYVTRGASGKSAREESASGGYRLTFRENTRRTREVQREVAGFPELTALLSQLTGYPWRPSAWCVQQPIPKACWGRRPFDLRVIVQKDGRGRWNVNGSYVRVAPDAASLLSRRGDYIAAQRFFPIKWGPKGAPFLSEIFALALRCASTLDEALGPLGDLGVDFLIDPDDNVWFLEANPGPGYLMLGPNDGEYWRQLSAPLAFASYLAGFPTRDDLPAIDHGAKNPAGPGTDAGTRLEGESTAPSPGRGGIHV